MQININGTQTRRAQRVLLVAPPSKTFRTPEEHLGIGYLAAEGRKAGHKVKILDCWLKKFSIDDTVKYILSHQFDVVGFSPSMDSREETIEIVKKLRKKGFNKFIIAGGYDATFYPKKYLSGTSRGLDLIFRGESDEIFPQLLNFLSQGKNWTKIPGIVYWKNKQVIINPPAERVTDLDGLPFPARDTIKQVIKYKTPAHVCDSRDCYNRCSFCSIGAFYDLSKGHQRWIGRSPKNIVKELKELQDIGITMVKFVGNTFFGGVNWKKRAYQLCKEVKQSNINIRFRISTRVNSIDKELFQKLKECGLFAVSIGVESGIQRKLDDYKKNTTVAQNLRAVRILEELGIYAQMGFILFDPWVTLKELKQEFIFLKKVKWGITKGISTSLFTPEGTEITERIKHSCGFKGKSGSNYIYEIQEKKARDVYKALKTWSKNSIDLYDMAIDPISAPKVVSPQLLKEFYKIYCKFRDHDMDIFETLIDLSEKGKSYSSLIKFVKDEIKASADFYICQESKIKKLYKLSGLVPPKYPNRYIY